jgi:cob(I)alamin adenosyltransferase
MKIYTKTGDKGETGLLGGVRVSKDHVVIEVSGALDETNSLLGVVGSQTLPDDVAKVITRIQHDLFDLGSRVAACLTDASRAAEFDASAVEQLEAWIDHYQNSLPPLTAFILPSGSLPGSLLHQTRSVCRRCERLMISLVNANLTWPEERATPEDRLRNERVYVNRLSDLLFVLARYVNQAADCPETLWQVGRDKSDL